MCLLLRFFLVRHSSCMFVCMFFCVRIFLFSSFHRVQYFHPCLFFEQPHRNLIFFENKNYILILILFFRSLIFLLPDVL